MQFRARKSGSFIGELNITPLVDMVFNLIIFLLLGTTFKTAERAFPIELPTASHDQVMVTRDTPVVFVKRTGDIFFLQALDGNPHEPEQVTREQLQARLKALRELNADAEISVRGEKEASLQSLMSVIDAAYGAGITRVDLPYEMEGKE